MHDNIFKIARIIRQRPSVSARDVAEALGYAEPKSVYYWLGKIGFTFKTFKEAVLSGIFAEPSAGLRENVASYDAALPVAEGFSRDGRPVFENRFAPFAWPGAVYALPWRGQAYAPEVTDGDWVVVGIDGNARPQTVVLLDDLGAPALARLIDAGEEPLLVEISFRRTWRTPFPPLMGRVASIVRIL